jgi:hypothetical protein
MLWAWQWLSDHPEFQSQPSADVSQRFQRSSIFPRTHEFATFCKALNIFVSK